MTTQPRLMSLDEFEALPETEPYTELMVTIESLGGFGFAVAELFE